MGELMTTAEVAELLRCSAWSLASMRRQGKGPAFIRVGDKRYLYRRADIEAWLNDRTTAQGE